MFFCLLDIDKDCRLQNSSGASCGLYALYMQWTWLDYSS